MLSSASEHTMETNDTICAISTPPGTGGIAVCRLSGPDAIAIADSVWKGKPLAAAESHTAHLGTVLDHSAQPLDQAVATVYRAPGSFTTQDTVEFAVHGSVYIQREIIASLCAAGARLADPGEFTRRAFVAGRFDLTQAEAIADLISATTRAQQRIALSQMKGSISRRIAGLRQQLIDLASLVELELDFSEEDVTFASRDRLRQLAADIHSRLSSLHRSFAAGQAIKNGIPTAIVGATNAGKSSLLNALTGDDRAIVSDIHGTTRDIIEDTISLPCGQILRLMDTAGLRQTSDTVEQLGIERTHNAVRRASLIIAVADITQSPDTIRDTVTDLRRNAPDTPVILALNKTDLLPAAPAECICSVPGEDTSHDIQHAENSDNVNSEDTCPTHTGTEKTHAGNSAIDEIKARISDANIEILTISAKTGQGIPDLIQTLDTLAAALTETGDTEGLVITNARHAQALSAAAADLTRVIDAIDLNISGDLLAQDIRQAIHNLAALTGDISSDTLLQTIFSRFCIGK